MLKYLVATCLLLFVLGVVQGQISDIPPASFNIEAVDGGVLCAEEVLEFSIGVTIPQMEVPPVETLDIMILMDVTGSMSGEINSVKNNIEQIATRLRAEVPDTRFGLATYADYPAFGGSGGDNPYRLLSNFNDDIQVFQNALNPVSAEGGGDDHESLLRGLWEVSQLEWRDGAIHTAIIFTDIHARDPDPGPDNRLGTTDDINLADAIAALNAKNIQVLSVQSRGSTRARSLLQSISDDTNGTYFQLGDANEIPDLIVTGVSGLVARSRFSFEPEASGATQLSSADDNWFRQSPSNFRYEVEGVNRNITITIQPRAINEPDGTYTLDLNLVRRASNFGTIPIQFEYYENCSDFYIPDTVDDDGLTCSDDIFWESPSILLSYTEDGSGSASYPRVGQDNFVFVDVAMRGPRDAIATVNVFASDIALITSFPTGWQTIGSLSQAMEANSQARFGPFVWRPSSEVASLRAIVSNPSDPTRNSADVSCENNVASVHRARIVLDNPTLGQGDNRVGGFFTARYAGNSPVFRFSTGSLDGFVNIAGDDFSNSSWQAPDVAGELEMLIASTPATNEPLPIAISDDVNGGMTIYYTVQESTLADHDTLEEERGIPWGLVIPGIIFTVAGLLLLLVFVLFDRNTRHSS